MSKILVVDDELNICELLKLYLENEGYTVFTANDGQAAVTAFQQKAPDLVLLDIMLPKMDGWQVCREIRKTSSAPIIMLTAKGETFDKVLGLELGADDYVVKPFDAKEVVARVKAVLRRTQGKNGNAEESKKVVTYDKLEINIANYELKVNGVQIDTPPKELELIYHFASNPNRVFTRDQLLDEVWGFEFYGDSRTVDVHVKRLREKLEGVSDKWELKTVWGVGYKFETKEEVMAFKDVLVGKKPVKSNIFAKYFLLFAAIFLVTLTVLGTALTLMVNAYSQNERTNLLKENVQSVSGTISSSLIMQDINSRYSVEKELMCESLYIISNSIDADVFVCDVEGNIILCKERAYSTPYFGEFTTCALHDSYSISSALLQRVYETGTVTGRITVRGQTNYIVGTTIVSDGDVIGYTFAQTQTGVQSLALAVIRIFLLSALACLMLAFICIWHLTKKMVTPLQQMSAAAKQFAIGDFSYRVKVRGCDELADLGIAFNDMADALDKTESSRASFVANVSHELKTPMTSIAGFIDGILDGTIPKEKQNYYLGLVSTEVRRLSRLVVAMLNMSKIESGEFQMKPNNYDISDQIIRILLTFEQKIEKKNIEIIGLEDLQPQYIVADPDMIYQVIYNLFDNAVKFTNEDGFIKVTLEDLGSQIRVSIKNSGTGIKAEELSRVFERFYKVDKSRSLDAKGAGLGLYIVKMMVEMHSGRIYAKSEDENTAEFVFTLPKAFTPVNKKGAKEA